MKKYLFTVWICLDHTEAHDLWKALGNHFASTGMMFHFAASDAGPGYAVRVSQTTVLQHKQVKIFVAGFIAGWQAAKTRLESVAQST